MEQADQTPQHQHRPIADALMVVLSPGVGPDHWARTGVIGREWALYQRLAQHFARVIVVTDGPQPDASCLEQMPTGSTPLQVLANPQGLDRSAWLAWLTEAQGPLSQVLSGCRTVVVKTNQFSAGEAALVLAQAARAQGVQTGLIARGGYLWSRFEAEAHGPGSIVAAEVTSRESDLCRGSQLVVGTTETMLEDLAWRYGLDPRCLRLVPNYVLQDGPDVPNDERETQTVLVAGQLVERKRVEVVIRAVAEVNMHSPCTLEVVGDGPLADELHTLAANLGLEVNFVPSLPHHALLERMARCSVFVQMSWREGHPKTVLEAMAAGAAVVVADAPGLSDQVTHGLTGLVVGAEPGALAHTLEPLLNDREWREALGTAARAKVRQLCALDAVVTLELEIARQALELSIEAHEINSSVAPVRWSPQLLTEGPDRAVQAWRNSLHGYAKRLPAADAARFLASLDGWVYSMQGEAAVRADPEGLHPKHRLTKYHDFFVEHLQGCTRVIDLGSGVGALACSIAERTGTHLSGQEIDPANLNKSEQLAANRGLSERCSFVLGDITKDRVPGEFDAIVLSNVLEHLADRPRLLRQWLNWYQPKRVLIRVPSYDREWRVPWKDELGVDSRLDDTHEIEFTREALEAELAEAGLNTTELKHCWGEYWLVALPHTDTQPCETSVNDAA